jgi:hypothetical protein
VGSIPDGVSGLFIDIILPAALQQKRVPVIFPGVKAASA